VRKVSYSETYDNYHGREEVTRENFAILRHVAFNLLSRATSLKGGISAKRQINVRKRVGMSRISKPF
jgi:hypothetical protein